MGKDKEKPEWLKAVERVEAQKKCAPNSNIDKKKENKITRVDSRRDKVKHGNTKSTTRVCRTK